MIGANKMTDIPRLTRKNYAIARLGCAVASALLLLILANIGGSGEFLNEFQTRVRLNGPVLSILFWILLFLVLNETLIRSLRYLWLKLEKKPENTASIKSSDLVISKSRGIAGIPYYRHVLEEAIKSQVNGVVGIVNVLLSIAFSLEASDIHISPNPEMSEISLSPSKPW